MISLAALAVMGGFSLNLLLSFALGMANISGKANSQGQAKPPLPLFQLGILFVSTLFLWVFFSFIIPSFWRGFAMYFLFFPLAALVCMGLECCLQRFFPQAVPPAGKIFRSFTAYDGLVPASLILSLALAGSFSGAVALSLSFAAGNLIAIVILNEIRRRSNLERVPRYLRGSPLFLISMGLLALISASAAGILFRILEVLQ